MNHEWNVLSTVVAIVSAPTAADAQRKLEAQLGHGQGLEPASYVIVREVPASDWGYGGQTQAARALAKSSAAQANAM